MNVVERDDEGRVQEKPAERYEVVVVGAGQSGLALGRELAASRRRFVILESAPELGAAWRDRWDSLVLFTPRRYSGLPGLPFPGEPDGHPTRDEVVAYLERYAATFDLPVRFDTLVRSLRTTDEGRFLVGVDGGSIEAEAVVVATGPFQTPFVPAVAEGLDDGVLQLHSTAYRRPAEVPPGRVLVVGGGNTGFQLAKELAATHDVQLAVGTKQTPLPQRLLGRDIFWWLTKTGILRKTVDTRLGRRARDRDTLIGSSPRELERRYGVTVRPRVVSAEGRTVGLADGTELEVDAVLWATGYRPDHSWLELPVFGDDGRLRHRRGVTDVPGVFFLGLSWQHTRGSALIGFVGDDASFVADRVAAHLDAHGDAFPTGTEGLQQAAAPEVVELGDGDVFDLRIAPVAKRIGDANVRMLAYNGSVPGPVLRVREGSGLEVRVRNDGDLDGTVHWHGLRLENRYDGTHETQALIPVGGSFSYRLDFPDPGVYWYHPHVREDYGQELGQYGNILVEPADEGYWPPAHRELALTLDDVLIEDGRIAPFSRSETTFAAMGRFGNTMLVGGETDPTFAADRGEVVRLYLTNTANTRVFDVALPGARLKLVGGDSGRVEREELVESVVLAPSERAVVDVHFERAGDFTLEHRTPERTYALATFGVGDDAVSPPLRGAFDELRENAEWAAERERLAPFVDAPPDKTLAFVAEMELEAPEGASFVCPMHPEVVSETPGRCAKCGMKLVADTLVAGGAAEHHEHHGHHGDHEHHEHHGHDDHAEAHDHGHHEGHGDHGSHDAGGIEWEDDMVELNRLTTPENMRWQLVDRDTGAINHGIDWTFTVGDRVKLRLVNEMDSDHPMHHPFHVHGAGRFVVLARDGVPEANLVWKDTVLVRTGETVDILLDVTNPGRWMAHCHIAEHHESGMMLSFDVRPAPAAA